MRKLDSAFFSAFPDYRREYLNEVVTDGSIAFTWHLTATHHGPFLGFRPTGLRLDYDGCSVAIVRDGHFASIRAFQPDIVGMLRREANIQLVQRLVEAENAADIDSYAACLAEDVEVWVNGRLAQSSRDGQGATTAATLAAFPDWRRETLGLHCDGDTAVLRWRGAGTHTADWASIPPSGNRIEFQGTSSMEIKNGLMQRIWTDMDMAGPLREMTGSK